ncbi:MAG: efflux RND transporter permease subunit [Pirellulales bacterium]|nr:efflux RND transporter permease subunit [Pirellulales bacterium]
MFAKFFIEHPIFSWVISIVIVLLGGVAVFTLPVAQYPDITPPSVQVTASYPGANAQVVADSVAAPIEQQVNGVERMMYMSSQSTNDGNYTLTVTFELGTDLNMAQVLVQNRVALAMAQLPEQVQAQGVNTNKQSPSILLAVNLYSPDGRYDNLYLSNYATIQIKDELLRIDGVGNITYLGERDYSMRAWLDPDKMATRNITAEDVIEAVKSQNVQVAAGTIGRPPVPKDQVFQLTMSTLGRLETVQQFEDIIIKTKQGSATASDTSTSVVRLKDIARLELGAQQYDQICQLDGMPSVALAIFQLPGSNAIDVAQQIKKKMSDLSKHFPPDLDYKIVYDTTPFIKESVMEVFKTLRDAIVLVAIVVLFFLQDWKAMILPMIDVPVSLVGTFAVMALLGFSLNNLTLFGLVLAIGIVVDDAIVVLENVERWIAKGYEPKAATINAMNEITGSIIAITLVLTSVFLPAAVMPGIQGQFFRQFALTISASMVISAINAMTLTPSRAVSVFKTEKTAGGGHVHVREAFPWWFFGILGAILGSMYLEPLIAPHINNAAWNDAILPGCILAGGIAGLVVGWFAIRPINAFFALLFKGFNQVFDLLTLGYSGIVGRSLRISLIVLVGYVGLLFATGYTMSKAPTGFIPEQDQGYLLVNVALTDSATVYRTEAAMQEISRIALGVQEDAKHYPGIPGVAHTVSVAGQSILLQANASNWGSMFVVLKDFSERHSHEEYDEVIAEKLKQLCAENAKLDNALISVFRAPPIQGLGNSAGFTLQVEQRGFVDLQELQYAAEEVVREGNAEPQLDGLLTMFRANTPQLFVDIDRTKCESLMVPVNEVFNALQTFMGGYYVNLFNLFGRTWQVNLLAEESYRTDAESVGQLKVRNKLGQMVPLGTLATVKNSPGPVMYMRYNMYPSAAINGDGSPGTSSGDVVHAMANLCDQLGIPYEWTTIYYLQTMPVKIGLFSIPGAAIGLFVFAMAATLVFLVLAAKYESWKLPLAIILVVPMCLLSSVLGMLMTHLPVDIFVQVGFVVLVGMAAKNAILIVEFAQQQLAAGKPLYEATVEACHLRLRPIVMTSFAFILGVVPLIISHGAGAEMRLSLGTAVFSGMIGVTVFGIILTPVFYYLMMYRTAKKLAAAKHREASL